MNASAGYTALRMGEELADGVNRSALGDTDIATANEVLAAIARVQSEFMAGARSSQREAFDDLLDTVLRLTQSEYGFIGEVLHEAGQPYLKTWAISDIAWNAETRAKSQIGDSRIPGGRRAYD